MTTFVEFLERLALGHLKLTAAVDKNNLGEIVPNLVDTMVSLVNQGLVDITTRNAVVSKQIDLVFITDVNTYPMVIGGVPSYLIEDDTEPFLGTDFVAIMDVFDEFGCRHVHDTNGHIMTPSFNTLRFTDAKMEEIGPKVRIRYQAKHAIIANPDTDTIDLPPNLENSLQLFVAALYFSHLNSKEHSARGDKYYALYLRSIGEDEARNISSVSEVQTDTRFADRGFV